MHALGLASLASGLGNFVGDAPLPGGVLLGQVLARGGVQTDVHRVLAEGLDLHLVVMLQET
ncbi:Uncharacterised protein [Klebsiella pneumoniae]|nr:Uncharacterised protein [Klebsiella pneumoniae]